MMICEHGREGSCGACEKAAEERRAAYRKAAPKNAKLIAQARTEESREARRVWGFKIGFGFWW